jgi:hypothetical protein
MKRDAHYGFYGKYCDMFRMFDTCWVWTPGTIESLITMIIVKGSKGVIEGFLHPVGC